jgi:hypothetical protein
MKNVTELTTELARVFKGIEDGTIDLKKAAEMNNAAGKIINAQRLLLEVATLNKSKVTNTFLTEQ